MSDKRGRRVGFQSALLVSLGVILGSFVLSVLAWWLGMDGVGALCMAVAVTGLISRLWGLYALKDVEVQALPERETLSPGQRVTVRYTVKNNKALPLIWLELGQDIPPRDCLVPDGGFRLTEVPQPQTGPEPPPPLKMYVRRFAFVMGRTELSWETAWTGVRRGVYRPGPMALRSGDGFGLTQSDGETPGLAGRMLVVWPRIVPVETWPFLRHVWTGRTGKAGWSEDPTVTRGVRSYEPGDPWKRIDWRVAARTDELMVRQFDTVTPLSVLFILDGAGLTDPEEGISLTASLILALERAGISCGLALPATAGRGPQLLRPEDAAVTAEGCLFALADFDVETAGPVYDEAALMSAAAESGQVWLVAEGAGSLSCPALAGKLSERGLRLLARRAEPGAAMSKICLFDEIRAGGAAKEGSYAG